MKRQNTGRYEPTIVGGENVDAFIPAHLPPDPLPSLGYATQERHANALLALGRLDGVSAHLPDKTLFLYAYVRKEAVLSSQIEGTQSSLSDLLLFELDEVPGVPFDDVVEVSNYVAALEHGLARLRGGFPFSNRLIREVHEKLMSRGRGSAKEPGVFRTSQNWIGGTRAGNATFVPPPHTFIPECMSALERFIHTEDDGITSLIRAALVHLQFETIHPFLDGNGRVGRLLITLMLCDAGILREPLLYLSLYFKKHRSRYYDLLGQVRRDGDWEEWILFFLDGVNEVAQEAVDAAEQIHSIFVSDRARIETTGRRAGSALRVFDALKTRPVGTLSSVSESTGLSFPATATAMGLLVDLGIAVEVTGKVRNRVFSYRAYLKQLANDD